MSDEQQQRSQRHRLDSGQSGQHAAAGHSGSPLTDSPGQSDHRAGFVGSQRHRLDTGQSGQSGQHAAAGHSGSPLTDSPGQSDHRSRSVRSEDDRKTEDRGTQSRIGRRRRYPAGVNVS